MYIADLLYGFILDLLVVNIYELTVFNFHVLMSPIFKKNTGT